MHAASGDARVSRPAKAAIDGILSFSKDRLFLGNRMEKLF